jgi:tRNA modification GTPase
MAGTTRDIIEVHLDLSGYPVILADTAGLRPDDVRTADAATQGAIEYEGIRRAIARAESADIRILIFDGTAEPDRHTLDLLNENCIVLFNKSDVNTFKAARAAPHGGLSFSATTGEGLEQFIVALTQKIAALYSVTRDTPSLTRERHRSALEECLACIGAALKTDVPELMAEDTRMAARAIGRITGRVDVEDLLDVIFRDFCIGK